MGNVNHNQLSYQSDIPIYNLKAVVKATGLKPDTLRAWERRYGLPAPQRTEGGHRLYTRQDIDLIVWLMSRQQEGLSISRAIALWRQLEESEQEGSISSPSINGEFSMNGTTTASPALLVNSGDLLAELRQGWLNACLRFDESSAEQMLNQAFALCSVEHVCLSVLQPTLAEIGQLWYQGRATAAQEHFASALATRRIDALLAATAAPTRSRRVLVACPPEESHTFVPLLISLLLRRQGWHVVHLGANVPLDGLDGTMETVRPDLVILTAQVLSTAVGLMQMTQHLYRRHVPVAFGGLIFNRLPDLPKFIPGHFLGTRLDDVVGAVERILANPQPRLAARVVGDEYQAASTHFQTQRTQIDAYVWREAQTLDMPSAQLSQAIDSLGEGVQAALLLGDMDYATAEIDWVADLLATREGIAQGVWRDFLIIYRDALHANLDARGQLATAWFDQTVKHN